jgi:hypothetical protein
MLNKLSFVLTPSIILFVSGCTLPKDADIVGAAVIAELAQTQNARPSDIVVDKVTFQNRRQANIDATYHIPDIRFPHSVTFICDATWPEDRWRVKCSVRESR